MNTETTPDGALSDDEYDRVRENVGDTLTRHGFDFDDWPDWHLDEFCAGLIRDVRAALLPPVTPLRPGERVTISDAHFPRGLRVHALNGPDRDLVLTASLALGSGLDLPEIALALDAAGVRALRDVCQRWLASQGDGK